MTFENLNHIGNRAKSLAPQISLINPKMESYAAIDSILKGWFNLNSLLFFVCRWSFNLNGC